MSYLRSPSLIVIVYLLREVSDSLYYVLCPYILGQYIVTYTPKTLRGTLYKVLMR